MYHSVQNKSSAGISVILSEFIAYYARKKNGLPAKKYHDITDYDVTTIDTVRHK